MTAQILEWKHHSLELDKKTRIMGIVNVTSDSFSDGGHFLSAEAAVSQAERMVAEGADIIDIGGESSRPFSEPVSAEQECSRVIPVIEKLADRIRVPVSIDTTKAEVARAAVSAGASVINDISALRFDPEIGRVIAETGALGILMHMKGMPADMQVNPVYDDLLGEVVSFLREAVSRAESRGVERSRLIVDPGIGFGKTADHNLQLLKSLHCLQQIGTAILVGSSRKKFIRRLLCPPDSGELSPLHPLIETGTQASVAAAAFGGAHIVRVHNVANTAATLAIVDAIKHSGCRDQTLRP
ncbi:MAG: dihydropteroate synthase [Desulfosalsimonadaceae bacterium]